MPNDTASTEETTDQAPNSDLDTMLARAKEMDDHKKEVRSQVEAVSSRKQYQEHMVKGDNEENPETVDEDASEPQTETKGKSQDAADAKGDSEEEPESVSLARIKRQEKRQREEYEKRKQELKAQEDQLSSVHQQLSQFKAAAQAAKSDPIALLRLLGYESPDQFQRLAQSAWVEAVGEDAPQEWREKVKGNTIESRLARIEADLVRREQAIEQREQQRSMQEAVANYYRSIESSLSTISEDDYPHVSAFIEEDPAQTANAMLQLASDYAEQNPQSEPLTPQDLADMFEENLAREMKVYERIHGRKANKGKASNKAAGQAKTPRKTLSNRNTQTTGTRTLSAQEKTAEERLKAATEALMGGGL